VACYQDRNRGSGPVDTWPRLEHSGRFPEESMVREQVGHREGGDDEVIIFLILSVRVWSFFLPGLNDYYDIKRTVSSHLLLCFVF
jgi:hypothetical protein